MNNQTALLAAALLIASCRNATPDQSATEPVPAAPEAPAVLPWAGTFADTLPCADCPGLFTRLVLRDDSTYVMYSTYIDRDSIPFGDIGQWSVAGEVLTLSTADRPMRWLRSGDRLVRADSSGHAIDTPVPNSIHRVAGGAPVAMHLTGGYVYYADSHSFTPCGSTYRIPVAMDAAGTQGAGLELERQYVKQVKKAQAPLFVRITGTLEMGPAMEGDGQDEYLRIQRIEQVLKEQECR